MTRIPPKNCEWKKSFKKNAKTERETARNENQKGKRDSDLSLNPVMNFCLSVFQLTHTHTHRAPKGTFSAYVMESSMACVCFHFSMNRR